MKRRTLSILGKAGIAVGVVIAAFAILVSVVSADSIFVGFLDGAQETPPNASPGTGQGTVVLNDAGTSALVSLTFSGLPTSVLKWHIHCPGAPGVPAGIRFDPGLSVPASNLKWNLVGADAANLQASLCYFNVHTMALPAGEIRGQIEPSSVGGVAELSTSASAASDTPESSAPSMLMLAGISAAAGAVIFAGISATRAVAVRRRRESSGGR